MLVKWSYCAPIIAFLGSMVAQAQTSGYFLDRMPTVRGATFVPTKINDAGAVAGNATSSTGVAAELIANGVVKTLPGMAGNNASLNAFLEIYSVNASAAGVGNGRNASGAYRGVYWDSAGNPWELVPPGGTGADQITVTADINNQNVSVGYATYGSTGGMLPMMWRGGYTSGMVQLEPLFAEPNDGESNFEQAVAISRNGEMVAGYGQGWDGPYYAEKWENGRLVLSQMNAQGYGINDSGTMVGYAGVGPNQCPGSQFLYDGCYENVAYMWGPHAVTLALLPGTTTSNAYSINDSNIVVGDDGGHAVKWGTSGAIVDLHKLMAGQLPSGTTLTSATQITDGGKILVAATTSAKTTTYYQLTPVIPTSIKLSSNINPSSYGQAIHLVASVIPVNGAPVPVGYVSWYDNGKLLGTSGLTAIGTASWEPSTWTPGLHKITVSYGGSSPNGASTSPLFNQTINAATTTTAVAAAATSVTHGQTVKLTATVKPAFGTIAGTVTFKNGSTILGSAAVNGSTKQATISPVLTTAGKYPVTASYAASADFRGSLSSVVIVTAN